MGQIKCQITIRMADGSKGVHIGNYACTVDAVICAMVNFPDATGISVKAVKS